MSISFNLSAIIFAIIILTLLSLLIKLKNFVLKILLIFCTIVLIIMLSPQILTFLQSLL